MLLHFIGLLAISSLVAPAHGRRVIRAAPGATTTGCYVVKLNDSVNHDEFMTAVDEVTPLAMEKKVVTKVEGIVKVFTMKMSHASAEKVKKLSNVEYVEEETFAHGTQSCNISWGIDRIDQSTSNLDCRYDPLCQGEGSDIYILDSGINFDHREFEECRAFYPGYDPMDAYNSRSSPSTGRQNGRDCHGHGTHVASLAAGRKSGSAQNAYVYSVRVLSCANFGPWSVVIDGINYAVQQIKASGRPSVISMSLGGGSFQAMDDAVRNAHSMGITVVVAAGNDRGDACHNSPARSTHAITVGGTARGDRIYTSTNGGTCVDIFAPGQRVSGADYSCNTCSSLKSGTSMATPIVSGVVAGMLEKQPLLTPNQVKDRLIQDSLKNVITNFNDFDIASLRTSTPNRLLNVIGSCGGEYNISNTQTLTIQSPNYPNNYPNNAVCTWKLKVPQDRLVVLTFTEINLQQRHDRVTVHDGYSADQTVLQRSYTGAVSGRPRHQSTGSTLTVQLYTSPSVGSRGFQATVSSISRPVTTTDPPTSSTSAPTTTAATSPTTTGTTSPTTAATTSAPVTCPTIPPQIIVTNENCNLTKSLDNFKVNLLKTMEDILVDGIQFVADLAKKPCNDSSNSSTNSSVPSLENIIQLGIRPENPADSCASLHKLKTHLRSGNYWVKQEDGSAVNMYCDLERVFTGNQARGWARIANFNMLNSGSECPDGLKLVTVNQIRSCGRNQSTRGCSSVFFSSKNIQYSKVCGRVRGYQHSSPNAFYWYSIVNSLTIDDFYVDGAVLTYNNESRREHIWTFAAALDEVNRTQAFACPCTVRGSPAQFSIPSFVGNDYFCETGSRLNFQYDRLYTEDPLWDGDGCGADSTCCNKGPYFCKNLPESTTSNLEIRVCGNEVLTNEDTPLDIIELFVQ